MPSRCSILLIDDSPGECELFRLALSQAAVDVALYAEQDGEAALHFLANRISHTLLPLVILLDWHLGKEKGDAFLKALRRDARFAAIPVVVFTTSDDASDIDSSYASGTNGYVVKPDTYEQLVAFVGDFCRYWLKWNRTSSTAGRTC